jgi:hypothetical protein
MRPQITSTISTVWNFTTKSGGIWIFPARNLLSGPTCARCGPFACAGCPGAPSLGTPSSVCRCPTLWLPMTISPLPIHCRPLSKGQRLDVRPLGLLQGGLEPPRRLGAQHGVAQHGVTARGPRSSSGGRGRRGGGAGKKRAFGFPSMLPLLSSPRAYVFLPCMLWALGYRPRLVWRLPVALGPLVANDLLSVQALTPVTRCSLRLSTRAGRPVGGDPIYPTASLQGPEIQRAASTSTRVRSLTQPRNTAYTSFRTAPSGKTPLLRKRHSAMSNFRATATIPMRLRRFPPPPKRSRNQQLKALSGW